MRETGQRGVSAGQGSRSASTQDPADLIRSNLHSPIPEETSHPLSPPVKAQRQQSLPCPFPFAAQLAQLILHCTQPSRAAALTSAAAGKRALPMCHFEDGCSSQVAANNLQQGRWRVVSVLMGCQRRNCLCEALKSVRQQNCRRSCYQGTSGCDTERSTVQEGRRVLPSCSS